MPTTIATVVSRPREDILGLLVCPLCVAAPYMSLRALRSLQGAAAVFSISERIPVGIEKMAAALVPRSQRHNFREDILGLLVCPLCIAAPYVSLRALRSLQGAAAVFSMSERLPVGIEKMAAALVPRSQRHNFREDILGLLVCPLCVAAR